MGQVGGHQNFFCFYHAAYPCLRQSVAVAVMRRLRRAPFGHAASSCWLRAYVRGSGPPGTPLSLLSCLSSGFLPSQWSTAPWSSEQRTPPCATAILFRRPLPSFFLLFSCARSSGNSLQCECSRHPWGMCLLLLRWSFLSHFPSSLCFDWA